MENTNKSSDIFNKSYDNLSRHFEEITIDSLFDSLVDKLMKSRIKQISDYAPRIHNLEKRARLELDLLIDTLLSNPIRFEGYKVDGHPFHNFSTTWDKALMTECSRGINKIKFATPSIIFSNAISNHIQRNLSAVTGHYDSIDCLTGVYTVIGRDEFNNPQTMTFNGGPIFEEELRKRLDPRFKITVDRYNTIIEVPFDYTRPVKN